MNAQPSLFGGEIRGDAEFSPCEKYRYTLSRSWETGSGESKLPE